MLRFNSNYGGSSSQYCSIDDYVKKMKEGQKTIYFAMGTSYEAAIGTPFYEPFKNSDCPVLVLSNQLDEFVLSQAGEHKGFKFLNIEQAQVDDIRKELGLDAPQESESQIPEEEVTNFCLWLKNTLSYKVATVKISKRLTSNPAILVGQMSSSMLMMM